MTGSAQVTLEFFGEINCKCRKNTCLKQRDCCCCHARNGSFNRKACTGCVPASEVGETFNDCAVPLNSQKRNSAQYCLASDVADIDICLHLFHGSQPSLSPLFGPLADSWHVLGTGGVPQGPQQRHHCPQPWLLGHGEPQSGLWSKAYKRLAWD